MSTAVLDVTSPAEISQLLTSGQPITLEYSTDLSLLKGVESVHARSVYTRNFQSLQIGGSAVNVQIQNRDVVKLVTVHAKLNPLPANVFVNRGWLLKAIRQLRFDIGGSEVVQMNKTQIWDALMGQCETSEKRMNLLRLAGEQADSTNTSELSAVLPLPLPWSTLQFKDRERTPGFDTRLINANINVYIDWEDPSCVFGGSGTYPTQFKAGYIKCQMDELYKSQDQLIRQSLLLNSLASYNYRFLAYQNYTVTPRFTGSTSECSADKVQTQLQAFRHGNLVSIVLNLRKVSDLTPDANGISNELMYHKISNLEVSFNGVDFWRLDEEGSDVEDMTMSYSGGSYVDYAYTPPGQVSAPYTSVPVRSYYTPIHFTPLSQSAFSGIVMTGEDMGGQTITLRFNTPDEDQYQLDASYVYQAHAVVSNSTAKIKYSIS